MRYQAALRPDERRILASPLANVKANRRKIPRKAAPGLGRKNIPCSRSGFLIFNRLFVTDGSLNMAEDVLQKKSFTPYVPKKGEEYMSARQLTHFRKILESIKKELSQDIDNTIHTMQDEATVFADPNDRASQETDIAIELRNRDRERKLIKKIDETLGRIEAEDYGFCDKCGVEIGIKRLEARPTATLCIDCKTLDEMKEKQVAK
ncbi:MAG TPA: RNA polymerase-binding protein DksA [Rhodocyclaceae bacterium]|nr:RNA polymerase-binding protein DksA [Rhodocyclaceae bacterium]